MGRIKSAFKFRPFSKKQMKILTWWLPESPVHDCDGIIADGAIRSGKTLSMSLAYVMWAMAEFDGQNFGMAGKTVGSFRRNVLFQLKQMLASRGYKITDSRSENLVVVEKKGVANYFYIFGGKDERSQDLVQGITCAGFFFDEVALMPESFVNQATGRCSVDGSKWWFNCNPGSPNHWFKTDWIDMAQDKNLLYLHFTMDDNLSLSERIKQRYRSMYKGVFFKRYIEGIWCVAEGIIYSMFDPEENITDEIPPADAVQEYVVSVDYGTRNPFSCGLWAFTGRRAVRIREMYYDSGEHDNNRLTDEQLYEKMTEMIGDIPVKQIIIDPSAASFIECVKTHRRFTCKSANNDVLDGIRVVSTMLVKGLIKVHSSCTNSIKEFGIYAWDEKSSSEKPVKESDHAMDDIRYFCKTYLAKRLRWRC